MYCTCGRVSENRETGECASCGHDRRKAERVKVAEPRIIKKMSHNLIKEHRLYINQRSKWIKGKKCAAKFVHNCSKVLTVHHSCGRGQGFYDEQAELANIPLLRDERLWIPLCLEAHQYIEQHPTFAKQNGYSEYRLTNKNL